MISKRRPFWQRVLIDALGFLMLAAVPLVGWIPGPGGVPLLLGGLGLLSINHEWARRLLHQVKTKGTSLYEVAFPENPRIYLLYDLIGIFGLGISIYLATIVTGSLKLSLSIAGIFFTGSLLLANRKRLDKITAYIQKSTKKRY